MDGNSSDCCLLCGEQLDGNGDVASPNSCSHVFHLICIKNWADIKINAGHPVTCPLQSCLKTFQSIGVKKNSKTMKVVNVIPVDQDWSCPICLNSMAQVNEIGNPEVCNHHFCLKCLYEWSQTNTSCPLDRMEFRIIFVKNAVGGAIQRRVRTPQRDLREGIANSESEDTEDDVEVTVRNTEGIVLRRVTATDIMNTLFARNPVCPECNTNAGSDGSDAILCTQCRSTFHRRCARVRGARNDQWVCVPCRQRTGSASQRGGRARPAVSQGRRNAIVQNEFHGEWLTLIGNRNYRSSEDDTYSYNTDPAVNASDDSISSISTESELSLSIPSRNAVTVRLGVPGDHVSSSDSIDVSNSRRRDDSSYTDSNADSDDSADNGERPRTRRAAAGVSTAVPSQPVPLRNDLFSQFSDSDEPDDDDSDDRPPAVPTRRLVSSSGSSDVSSDDSDDRDGRRSRVSRFVKRCYRSSGESSSSHSNPSSEASEDDFAEPPPPPKRRRRMRSSDSGSDSPEPPAGESLSRAGATASRPRRTAAPSNLAEPSFNDSIEETPPPRPSRPSASTSRGGGGARGNRRRGGVSSTSRSTAGATAAARRPVAGPSRGRRAGNSGSARTAAKRKKSKPKSKSSGGRSRKRTVKKSKVIRKAKKRQKKAKRESRQPSIVINPQLPNRSQSTDGAPRLSLLGEGRFPSGPYDTMLYTPALPQEATVSSTQGNASETSNPPPVSAPSDPNACKSFLTDLLAGQSKLFTPTKYLRVNASDGSLFAVTREELTADLLTSDARRTSSPPTSESPPSASELQPSTSSSSPSASSVDQEPVPSSSNVDSPTEAATDPLTLTYSPVEDPAPAAASDVEVDSTPLTDISSSTLGGIYAARTSQGTNVSEHRPAASPERVRVTAELVRSDFGTRREFEAAVANIAKRTVGKYYSSRVLNKDEYKAQLKRIVQKVSGSGHAVYKVKNIVHLAEKCVGSFIKSRPHSSQVKK